MRKFDREAAIGLHALHHALHIHRQAHHVEWVERCTTRHDIVAANLGHHVAAEAAHTLLATTTSATPSRHVPIVVNDVDCR